MKCWQSHRYDISPGISDVHDSVSWLPGKEIATGCYVNTTIDQTKRHVNQYFERVFCLQYKRPHPSLPDLTISTITISKSGYESVLCSKTNNCLFQKEKRKKKHLSLTHRRARDFYFEP